MPKRSKRQTKYHMRAKAADIYKNKTMKNQIGTVLLAFLIFCPGDAFSQAESLKTPSVSSAGKDNTNNGVSPELKKDAVEFLKNTAVEVNNMRTLENRISFSAEMASLMWFDNEAEARAMYHNVINGFRQLISLYDAQLNAFPETSEEMGDIMLGTSEETRIAKKFMRALGVRQQITTSLAEHDARLALEFFTETAQAISNPDMRKRIEQQDTYFEMRLLQQIAENDIDAAFKFARKNVEKGLNYETIRLLRKIYEKDGDKGISLGEDILNKVKNDSPSPYGLRLISELLSFGEETAANKIEKETGKTKRPVFSSQQMREMAEAMAQEILGREDGTEYDYSISQIEKYAPARAVQIRRKFGIKKNSTSGVFNDPGELTPPLKSVDPNAKKDIRTQLKENLENLGNKELDQEQKQKVVEQSRKIIDSIGDRSEKILALSGLAFQVASLGDKKLATELLDSARGLANFQPVNYRDYLETWMLISGYAQVDAEKAFPMIEAAIYRVNDTITSFVKVAEFIDVEGEIIEEGEVQLGSFGGGLTQGIVRELGIANSTVRTLAIADFKRTKDLTNRFDRQEVRILAKMLVLRAILGNDKQGPDEIIGPGF